MVLALLPPGQSILPDDSRNQSPFFGRYTSSEKLLCGNHYLECWPEWLVLRGREESQQSEFRVSGALAMSVLRKKDSPKDRSGEGKLNDGDVLVLDQKPPRLGTRAGSRTTQKVTVLGM